MHTSISKEAAKELLYRSPLADNLTGMYKDLTGIGDVQVVGRSYPETGVTTVHTTGPLILGNGSFSQRYGVMLLANGETTKLLVVDPLRGEPSNDSMQPAQLVVGLEAGSLETGERWVRLNKFDRQNPQRALEPRIHDLLRTRADRAFTKLPGYEDYVYFVK